MNNINTELRDDAKLIIKYVMRFFLKIFWIFPISPNRVFFMANMGKGYLCNPKYLYQSMLNDYEFSDYKFVWCFKKDVNVDNSIDLKRTTIVRKNSLAFFYYLLTSKVVIYNCGGFSYAPVRKKQYLIETGHGGGLQKKNGFLLKNKSKASNHGIKMASEDIKLWISTSRLQSQMYIHDAMAYDGEIIGCGYPRSDLFFTNNETKIKELKQLLGISEDTKIVLYAPTFKGDESHAVSLVEGIEKLDIAYLKSNLETVFGGKWIIAKRGHQYSKNVSIDNCDYDWSDYPDMQELLLISDVLITDYSSCMWDFAIMKKPCFLYVPDLEKYKEEDRGFYIPIESWPGVIVSSNKEWKNVLQQFSEEDYLNGINQYLEMMGSFENGNACRQVKSKILKNIRKRD